MCLVCISHIVRLWCRSALNFAVLYTAHTSMYMTVGYTETHTIDTLLNTINLYYCFV